MLLPKLFWPYCEKICSSDQEKLLKFDAEGQLEFKLKKKSLEFRHMHNLAQLIKKLIIPTKSVNDHNNMPNYYRQANTYFQN